MGFSSHIFLSSVEAITQETLKEIKLRRNQMIVEELEKINTALDDIINDLAALKLKLEMIEESTNAILQSRRKECSNNN